MQLPTVTEGVAELGEETAEHQGREGPDPDPPEQRQRESDLHGSPRLLSDERTR